MATTKEQLIEWLEEDIPAGALIGIDDGGLTLRVIGENAYYEVGGIPENDDPPHSTDCPRSLISGAECLCPAENAARYQEA